ncbi:hypothetical protein PoB_005531900 [Plakobranchus ocellatus]|uniref:Uncharacterized protein n=1 Tax=Plakobranchus ocellatus TaxID=259542 RepID=A0AAV4CDK8_9GAST|nr:hypothetical protein PoB_005531900 [Plakobranchus ocellatus]
MANYLIMPHAKNNQDPTPGSPMLGLSVGPTLIFTFRRGLVAVDEAGIWLIRPEICRDISVAGSSLPPVPGSMVATKSEITSKELCIAELLTVHSATFLGHEMRRGKLEHLSNNDTNNSNSNNSSNSNNNNISSSSSSYNNNKNSSTTAPTAATVITTTTAAAAVTTTTKTTGATTSSTTTFTTVSVPLPSSPPAKQQHQHHRIQHRPGNFPLTATQERY